MRHEGSAPTHAPGLARIADTAAMHMPLAAGASCGLARTHAATASCSRARRCWSLIHCSQATPTRWPCRTTRAEAQALWHAAQLFAKLKPVAGFTCPASALNGVLLSAASIQAATPPATAGCGPAGSQRAVATTPRPPRAQVGAGASALRACRACPCFAHAVRADGSEAATCACLPHPQVHHGANARTLPDACACPALDERGPAGVHALCLCATTRHQHLCH